MEERWLPIPGYEGLYSVSDRGRVKAHRPKLGAEGDYLLQPFEHKGGYQVNYRVAHLTKEKQPRKILVHRLVLMAFVGPCPEGHEADHIDKDRSNNNLTNLRWRPVAENRRDGPNEPIAKLTPEDVAAIRAARGIETGASLAKKYGVHGSLISQIQLGRRRKGS